MKYLAILIMTIMLISCNDVSNISDKRDENNQKVVIIKEKEELVELTGLIKEVYDNSVLIETETGDPYVVHLMEDVVMNEFSVGNNLTIGFSGAVMESYPMQVNAISIISNEN